MIKDLKTEFWVSALIRRAQIGGANAYIMHKGDMDAGSVLIKINNLQNEIKLLAPSRNINGDLIFVDLAKQIIKETDDLPKEAQIDNYTNKRIAQDRDLWIIEIEDKEARDFLIEKIE